MSLGKIHPSGQGRQSCWDEGEPRRRYEAFQASRYGFQLSPARALSRNVDLVGGASGGHARYQQAGSHRADVIAIEGLEAITVEKPHDLLGCGG
jgi:hypothetical protein